VMSGKVAHWCERRELVWVWNDILSRRDCLGWKVLSMAG
jgi:hypothetical protein